jgi:hypothetical protein
MMERQNIADRESELKLERERDQLRRQIEKEREEVRHELEAHHKVLREENHVTEKSKLSSLA